MPLHGKIVVIKRSGGDGTEFPLTATCLFGRKPDCDIRIQLPQVSKEHCRIDFNENKEVILTNLSSVNPTRVNGAVLQQSERLKHGDVITVIDRSFRFEYPPAPTPRKRSLIGRKSDFKVLQDQQVRERSVGENRTSETSTGPQLKDGTNQDNIHSLLENTVEQESKEEEKSTSPFSDLYQMIKKSLDVKTPRRSSVSHQQTPSSRFCSPKPVSVKKNSESLVFLTKDKATTKDEIKAFPLAVEINTIRNSTSNSVKKQRNSSQVPSNDISMPEIQNAKVETPSVQKRISVTPQRFTSSEVVEQVTSQNSKSAVRRSKEATPAKQAVTSPKTESRTKASPRNFRNVDTVASKKRKSEELSADLPKSQMKRKRVSFGSNLSPELFDKRMPPDSPLRKGATPRRSFCLSKPKESLLRRVSVIGMIQENPHYQSPANMKTPSPTKSPMTQLTGKKSPGSRSSPKAENPGKKTPKSKSPSPNTETPGKKTPKSKSPSPKAETPGKKTPKSRSPSPKAETPGKKTPKSRSPSPKAETPGKKTPKSRSPSPKAETPGKKTPKSRSPSPKAETPGKKTPKSRSPSPKAETPGKKTPKSKSPSPKAQTPRAGSLFLNNPSPGNVKTTSRNKVENPGVQTPTIKGRFSVSRISTPSPTVENGDTNEVGLDNVTPKLRLKRKSMKSSARKSVMRSTVKVMCRKSVISRASMKAMNSWADIVKFGQRKAPVGRPVKTKVNKTTVKKAVCKPQTPASKLKGQVTTGHAESPVTIVVGRAHRQKVACPAGAAPRWISNTRLLKEDMQMDEDLTEISEMYKTPVMERKQRAVTTENSAKTPVGDLSKSVVEPSALNTPEEPGEMMVSPLSVSTSVKERSYNREAVQRLLIGEHESVFVSEIPAMVIAGDSPKQSTDSTTSAGTNKQEPVLSNRQKVEFLEDLHGKVLKTPKRKIEHMQCLTGVKRIMKTPRQKAEPLEDIRGKILKTPKQKIEQKECLTGVKRIMKTPKQNTEPLEDLRGKILMTPQEKIVPHECLTGMKRIFSTPQQQAVDPQDEYLESHEAALSDSVDLPGMLHCQIPPASDSSLVCLSGVKRLMRTPRVKAAPVEDMVGVKRLLKTPREKGEPVVDNFGIKRLMKSPKLKANEPVEDFEGLKELMMEPLVDPTEEQETNEIKDQTTDGAKGADKTEVAADDYIEQMPHWNESSDTSQTIQAAEESEVIRNDDSSEEKLKPQTAVRGRRAKEGKAISGEEEQKAAADSEESAISAPVRGRRGKKTEATAPPVVQKSMRSRNAKSSESRAVALSVKQCSTLSSNVACKPKRGRHTKKASDDPAEVIPEVVAEAEIVPEPKSEQTAPANVNQEANENPAAPGKPRRGRSTKQLYQPMPENEDVPLTPNDCASQTGKEPESNEDFRLQPALVPSERKEKNFSDTTETAPEELATPRSSEVETTTHEITETDMTILKKFGRSRRAKVELRRIEDNQVVENPIVDLGNSKRVKQAEITQQPILRKTTRSRNAMLQECKSKNAAQEESVQVTQVSEVNAEAVSVESSALSPHHREAATKPTRGRKTKQGLTKPFEPEKEETVSKEQPQDDDKPEKPCPTLRKNTRGKRTKTDDVQTAAVEKRELKSAPPVRAKRGRINKRESLEKETSQSQEPVKNLGRTRKVGQHPVDPSIVQNHEQELSKEAEAPVDTKPTKVEPHMATRARQTQKAAQVNQLAESEDVQKSAAISMADKPPRGKRGKQVVEDVAALTSEEKPELRSKDENNEEQEATVVKRRAKSIKSNVPETIPAKRARRGTSLPPVETKTEPADLGSKSESYSKELPKRGRRAGKSSADVAILSGEELAVGEDAKMLTKSVKWKNDVEVFEIQKLTPVKPGRGRKSKVGDRGAAESQKDSSKIEEKYLSDKVEVQTTKRTRRGAVIVEASTSKEEHVEPEMQPKTRRGRLAKK